MGFKGTYWGINKAISRDKALYYFCKNNIDYKYIWFIEEDVFIPSHKSIENLNDIYPEGDLLCKENQVIYDRTNDHSIWWHWPNIIPQIKLDPPYSKTLICAIRCSKNMMNAIHDYANKHNNLFMDEALFTTLAIHYHLSVVCPHKLSTIHWRYDWNKWEITNQNNLYHPIKDINNQYDFRN